MNAPVTDVWPWFAFAGLGAFHGLNPGMGWLFAVALGLHRHDRRIVWLSPIPIALGHALSIGAVAGAFIWAGLVIEANAVRVGSGLFLIGWAAYHWRYGHRHRVRFGMQAGMVALVVWSFLMATAHGAGLMLWPALMPFCVSAGPGLTGLDPGLDPSFGPLPAALMGIGLHTLAMLTVTTLVAIAVYEWAGLEILRRAWINIDLVWTLALVGAGGLLMLHGLLVA
jgi:hypothetical protein